MTHEIEKIIRELDRLFSEPFKVKGNADYSLSGKVGLMVNKVMGEDYYNVVVIAHTIAVLDSEALRKIEFAFSYALDGFSTNKQYRAIVQQLERNTSAEFQILKVIVIEYDRKKPQDDNKHDRTEADRLDSGPKQESSSV